MMFYALSLFPNKYKHQTVRPSHKHILLMRYCYGSNLFLLNFYRTRRAFSSSGGMAQRTRASIKIRHWFGEYSNQTIIPQRFHISIHWHQWSDKHQPTIKTRLGLPKLSPKSENWAIFFRIMPAVLGLYSYTFYSQCVICLKLYWHPSRHEICKIFIYCRPSQFIFKY